MIRVPEKITESFIKKHLCRGDVLFWENYEFKNKTNEGDVIVILTECKNDSFLAIRATTNTKRYQAPSHLQKEFIILSPSEDPLFTKPTT